MARVLLIRPPLTPEELFAPGTDDASTLSPPLGIAYIAAYLRERGHTCVILDGWAEPTSVEAVADAALEYDVVGITVLTAGALRAAEVVSAIRKRDPHRCIVVGGAHVTAVPESLLDRGADYAVVGEGEETMRELLESLFGDGRPIESVQGIVFRRDGQYVRTGFRAPIEPLDRIPLPARDLLPMSCYRDSVVRSRGLTAQALVVSRGCPGTCTFCHKQTFGTKVRYFSVARIVEEMFLLQDQYHARHVSIYDDNFATSRDLALEVCDELRRRRFAATWSLAARVDAVDEPVLRALKRAGCVMIEYGIESGSQRILDRINKRATKEQIRTVIRLTNKVGLASRGFFILGFPTETAAEMEETIQFALELDMDLASFTLLSPLPGTLEYRRALETGVFRDPEYYLHEITSDFAFPEKPLYVPDGMTAEELLTIHRDAYRRYYFRPRMVFRKLLTIRSVRQFLALAKGALSLAAKRS